MEFPKDFLWGAATSAHQVEGGNRNDWTEWEALGKIANGERSGASVDHYNRFREDFALAKELGNNAHRFSIEWSRIEPDQGVFDENVIAHYRDVLKELRRLEIEPVVTLHHFTNPIWIAERGGWTRRSAVTFFAQYVRHIVSELGDLVRYWVTINEPTVYAELSYLAGYWPPDKRVFVLRCAL